MLARQSFAKVCPCTGGRCLTASLSKAVSVHPSVAYRHSSTEASSKSTAQSIFDPDASPWESIFEDIKAEASQATEPPPVHARHLKYGHVGRTRGPKAPRAVAITRRETQAVTDMFNAVFLGDEEAVSGSTGGIGQLHTPGMNVLFGKLRQNSKRMRWTSQEDQDLDRKKEEMELCETDLQLVEWTMREVFGESQRYEEEARRAADQPADANAPAPAALRNPGALQLQPASYPHLLAALMRTFRDKYKDPHLALSMFDHARNLSVASYVFGCTTPAYNELIETRWQCFRDLRGVCDALDEMRVNGVELDNRTRSLMETVRREVGERTFWQEESSLGSGEVWDMVGRLERLIAVARARRGRNVRGTENLTLSPRKKWTFDQESWKSKAMDTEARDGWQFDKWEKARLSRNESGSVRQSGHSKVAMRY